MTRIQWRRELTDTLMWICWDCGATSTSSLESAKDAAAQHECRGGFLIERKP